jgi:uncharacterized protein YecE (DUF72 family)
MGTILIGTCGYYYPKEWADVFYPPRIKRNDLLSFYAGEFNTVELDFSWYSIPLAINMERMIEQTNSKLMFSIKGHQSFTHHIEISQWRDAVKEYRKGILPLLTNNVLSSVILQFPESFHYEKDTRIYLNNLIEEFDGIPLVVEFRHNSWQNDRVYEGLNKRGVGLCLVDLPEISKLPKFVPVITGDIAYMRFHGRNKKNWHTGNNTTRYDYAYSDEELEEYKKVLFEISQKSKVLQIFFNNHAKASAPVNAKKMMALLSDCG